MQLKKIMTVCELKRVLTDNGFEEQKRTGKGSTHVKYRNGSYVFVLTDKGRARDVSPAQIKQVRLILEKMLQNDRQK